MALTKEERQKLDETHDSIIEIKTVLLGTDGYNGLVGDIKRNSQAILTINNKYNKLNVHFWQLVGVLVGSGVIGGGTIGLINALK